MKKSFVVLALSVFLASCAFVAPPQPSAQSDTTELLQAKSRWVPVPWTELPGFSDDSLYEAWNAWLKSCEKPSVAFVKLCSQVRALSIASEPEQRVWMQKNLQPYRVESITGESQGLLTAYYEPVLIASRQANAQFKTPLYQPPKNTKKPWFTRQEIDTLQEAQSALQSRAIAYLENPIDALSLQIQGSGRLRITEPDGSTRTVRLSFAGSNDQPYRSVGAWLLAQGNWRDASWPGIKAWLAQNPQRTQELLWSNPRVVFFKEEALNDNPDGPRGAQGVALTPGRSIAVDPGSIPYGTPVWLTSSGAQPLQKLVLAQDTGSAITGAVRADYFAGTGTQAGELAGRLKQPLRMWVLWPM